MNFSCNGLIVLDFLFPGRFFCRKNTSLTSETGALLHAHSKQKHQMLIGRGNDKGNENIFQFCQTFSDRSPCGGSMRLFFKLIIFSLVVAEPSRADVKTTIDPGFYTSARAGALANALSGSATGLDAAFWNPALIGGTSGSKQNIRNLHLPYLGISYNKNAQDLKKGFDGKHGDKDPVIGESLVNSTEGERQYGRFSMGSDVEWKRILINGFSDVQSAAVSPRERSPDPVTGDTMIALKYRQASGVGMGFSWMNTRETLAIGWYSAIANIKELEGELSYEELIDYNARRTYISQNMSSYTAILGHYGLWYRIPHAMNPTFTLVTRNPGHIPLKNVDSTKPDGTLAEEWTMGFSLHPRIGDGILSWNNDIARISEHRESMKSKFSSSLELSFGGSGTTGTFSLRAGANRAGLSLGMGVNMGILNFDVANQAVDLGDVNDRMVERRTSGVLSVNVREF